MTYSPPTVKQWPVSGSPNTLDDVVSWNQPSTNSWTNKHSQRAVYTPVVIQRPTKVVSIGFRTSIYQNDFDVGIYNASGTALYRSGSFTPSSGWNVRTPASPLMLVPGVYYLAWWEPEFGSGGMAVMYTADLAMFGQMIEDSLTTGLPATASWTAPDATGQGHILWVLVTNTATGS